MNELIYLSNNKMGDLLEGDWTCNDFIEAREQEVAMISIKNSTESLEFKCTIKLKSPSCLNVCIENQNDGSLYNIDILPRDLLVPSYKKASLLWLKLLLGHALKGQLKIVFSFITFEELKVNSIFIRGEMNTSPVVTQADAAGVLVQVAYELDEETYKISIQVPKILEECWSLISVPEEISNWREPTELSNQNVTLQEKIYMLQQENVYTMKQVQDSQQQIIHLREMLKDKT